VAEGTKLKILNPTVPYPVEKGKLAPRLDTLNGKVVGFLGNAFPGADRMLKRVEEIITSKYELDGVVIRHKSYLGEPATKEVFDEMVSSCDAVFTAIGA